MSETAKHPGFFKTSWEATEKTFMKSNWVNAAELPEDMKIALEPGAMLEGYSQPSQNNHVKFAEAWLNGEPVKPEICFINRAHWKRLAIEEPVVAPAPEPVLEPVAPPVLAETGKVIEPGPAYEPVAPPVLEETSPVAEPEALPAPEPALVVPEPVHEPAAPPVAQVMPVYEPAVESAPASVRELPPRRTRAHFLQKLSDFFTGKN